MFCEQSLAVALLTGRATVTSQCFSLTNAVPSRVRQSIFTARVEGELAAVTWPLPEDRVALLARLAESLGLNHQDLERAALEFMQMSQSARYR